MQVVKVVITSALVLAACAEGLPEGNSYTLKFTLDVRLVQVFANNIQNLFIACMQIFSGILLSLLCVFVIDNGNL